MEENIKYVGYKILLKPTENQKKIFNEYFGARRYIYNWGINVIESYYKNSKDDDSIICKHLSYKKMTSKLTELKREEDYDWLNEFDVYSLRASLRDLDNAYKKFFNGISNKPIFHTKKHNSMIFSVRSDRLVVHSDRVYLPSIGDINIEGDIPDSIIGYGNKASSPNGKYSHMLYTKYMNARVIFDGYKYYLTVSVEQSERNLPSSCKRYKNNEVWQHKPPSDIIGIDMGCKEDNWMVMSDGTVIHRPSQKKEDKRITGYQRKFARQLNALMENLDKKCIDRAKAKHHYSNSMIKTLTRRNKIEKKITNRKKNEAREAANYLLRLKPRAVVFEDTKFNDWLVDKNNSNLPTQSVRKINKQIKDSMLYTARKIIIDILKPNDIPVIYADREYPSTQLCSNCGNRVKMTLKQRVYECKCCGLVIDRDLNAAINLKCYGENLIYDYDYIEIA